MRLKYVLIFCCLLSICSAAGAQLLLTADGPGNTYERINAALAPGYNVVENPECVHGSFGRHIAEVFDTDINQYAFEFYAHVTPDNDRCINFDRQRIEIKTYDQSPDSLIGTTGEFITYKWRFKIPAGFQPSSSFTHIHQVKAVGGDDDQPIFTLTARKGTPNKMELIHVVSGSSGSSKVQIVNLSLFEGVWVEATEQFLVGLNGTYSMNIKRVSDGVSILNYSAANINTIRADNDFVRPKWGLYRSLNTPADLRDESIRFSYFSIKEGLEVLPVTLAGFTAVRNGESTDINWKTIAENNTKNFIIERSADGIAFGPIGVVPASGNSQGDMYEFKDVSPAARDHYYRLKITDHSGAFSYSEIRLVKSAAKRHTINIFPNPVKDNIQVSLVAANTALQLTIITAEGKQIFNERNNLQQLNLAANQLLPSMKPGVYYLKINDGATIYNKSFIKQ